jgi:enterochelin esterase-like enzyme
MSPIARTPPATLAGLVAGVAVLMVAALFLGPRLETALRAAPPALTGQPEVVTTTIPSEVLGHPMPIEVWIPAGTAAGERLPVLYLFHGVGGNASSWFSGAGGDGVGVAGIARDLIAEGRIPPIVIVSAAIDNSYGVDSSPVDDGYAHAAYGTYLHDELIPAVEARFPVSTAPTRRLVGGLSMGAFAAAHLALRDPGRFAGVGLLSPAMFLDLPADRAWQYGADPAANDPLLLATTADVQAWRVFVGLGDSDYAWIRASAPELVARLRASGAAVEEQMVAGGHDVGTWRALAGPMLAWLLGTRATP